MTASDPPDDGEGFLTRWSRRKRQIAGEAQAMPAAPLPQPASEPEPDDRLRDPETGEIIDEDLVRGLPDVAALEPGADLSVFMQKGVPEQLRRDALRRLWVTDPAIRDFVSPALDYAYDYNTPGGAPGFGPLSPGDIEQAREFLATVFSTPKPVNEDAEASTGEPAEADAVVQSDMESQSAVQLADPARPVAVRRSDTAVQHGRPGEELQSPAESGPNVADGPDNTMQSAIAAAQHSRGSSTTGSLEVPQSGPGWPVRRRGGGATPV
jgi:Protein of unknown function (DUF3306)